MDIVNQIENLSLRMGQTYDSMMKIQREINECEKYLEFIAENYEPDFDEEVEGKASVYFIEDVEDEQIKIGVSNDPTYRLKQLRGTKKGARKLNLVLLGSFECPTRIDAYNAENYLHKYYAKYHVDLSYKPSSTEWFYRSVNDERYNIPISYFKSYEHFTEFVKDMEEEKSDLKQDAIIELEHLKKRIVES